jgi:hypothetical protein
MDKKVVKLNIDMLKGSKLKKCFADMPKRRGT